MDRGKDYFVDVNILRGFVLLSLGYLCVAKMHDADDADDAR